MTRDQFFKQAMFPDLLKNEQGFHQLFCDLFKKESFSLYHNGVFAEDPIFNHFVISEELLSSTISLKPVIVRGVIEDIMLKARSFKLYTTIFIENFWPRLSQFEESALDLGYRVVDRMEILSKNLDSSQEIGNSHMAREDRFEVDFTEDYKIWNKVFMSSYAIPRQWEAELLKREEEIVRKKHASFVLVRDRKRANMPSGCLLTFEGPEKCTGIYCVGTIPEQRGKGVAREMLLSVEESARSLGKPVLTLQTLNSDGVAPMYKKMGYRTEYERDILYSQIVS